LSNKTTKAIPVTILTGFLGAGKTTLLNELIQSQPNTRFAIIENEFGEIGIDNELVIGADEGIFEMANGCICCSLNDELTELLIKLIRSDHEFDHLIIETTGMAEPDAVAASFLADPGIQEFFKLDGTVCLVDARNVGEMLQERIEVKKQIVFADHILINKQSEVDKEKLENIKQILSNLNPFASISFSDFAKTEENLLQLKAYDSKNLEDKIGKIGHHHHHHDDVATHSFVFEEAFDLLKLRHWINVLLMIQGSRIYRIKGVVNFQFKEERMIFQSVRQMHVFQQGKPWKEGVKRESKLVFIGPGLKREPLERSLRTCLYK
jgi:G3E family GTPase